MKIPEALGWRTNGDTCLNCGKRITQHKDQTFCPPANTVPLETVITELERDPESIDAAMKALPDTKGG